MLRAKPADRLVLVSDAVQIAGTSQKKSTIGGLEVEVRDAQCRLVSDGRLAASLIALDSAVRNLARGGAGLVPAVRAATVSPLTLLDVADRGHLRSGQVADLVQLNEQLEVTGDMISGAGPGR